MAKKAVGKIDKHLEKAVNDLIREVTLDKKDKTGEDEKTGQPIYTPRYTLNDVVKVVGLRLKLEAIRMKADDSGYASGFENNDGEND